MMDGGVELRLSRAGVPWSYTKDYPELHFTDLKVLSRVEAEFAILLRIVLLTALKPSEYLEMRKRSAMECRRTETE